MLELWATIAEKITQVTGKPFQPNDRRSVGGGCINQGYAISDGQRIYFVKLNLAVQIEMFIAEAIGLKQMQATRTLRIPEPIVWGTAGNHSYLVMEWLNLGRGDSHAWAAMGQQLAKMHQVTGHHANGLGYGWERNNTIGSTPQINNWTEDWAEFFAQHRLGYQFALARRKGGHFPKQDQLLKTIPQLLANHHPLPSLLHGDLWSGNAAITQAGEPVIFDPATYVGDREADLAMTELFGGFPPAFYQGYNEVFPVDSGYRRRKILYNLYHILNHFNLFGSGYEFQANQMIDQLLTFSC